MCYSVPFSRLMVSCDQCHSVIPECFHYPKTKSAPRSICHRYPCKSVFCILSLWISLFLKCHTNVTGHEIALLSCPLLTALATGTLWPISSPFDASHGKGQGVSLVPRPFPEAHRWEVGEEAIRRQEIPRQNGMAQSVKCLQTGGTKSDPQNSS